MNETGKEATLLAVRSNAGLGCKLTKAQQACIEKLRQIKADGGWIYNHCDNIGFQQRVLDALIERGLVEYDRGHYRVTPNLNSTTPESTP